MPHFLIKKPQLFCIKRLRLFCFPPSNRTHVIAKSPQACTNSKTMRRVLVIRFSSLGDIILTFSALAQLAEDGCEVHFLTKEAFRPLLNLNAHVSQIHTIPNHASFSDLKEKTQELKQFEFDHVYDLHRNLRSWITIFMLGASRSRIWKNRFKELFLFLLHRRVFNFIGLKPIDRAADARRLVQEAVSKSVTGSAIKIEKLHESVEGLQKKFTNGYVCVAMESAWPEKQWPAERFIEMAKRLTQTGMGVVWIGLRPISSEACFVGTLNLTEKLTIGEVASVLFSARMLLSNDSGLMHLSEAVGTPVAAIFGPTTRELGFAPSLRASRIAEADLWCRPCSKTGRGCFRPFQRRKCLTAVSTDSAWNIISNVLAHSQKKKEQV